MGRALTQTLHGVHAENLAGPLGPEVVASNIFTVASTEHQLIPVFLLQRFQNLISDIPLIYAATVYPTPGSGPSGRAWYYAMLGISWAVSLTGPG